MQPRERVIALPGYEPARRGAVDFQSHDGRRVVDMKLGAQGIRDLYGALLHLATLLQDDAKLEQACLVIRFPRLSFESARDAWLRAKTLLRESIAKRLALILVRSEGEPWVDPASEDLEELACVVAGAVGTRDTKAATLSPASQRFFDIWKVLLDAWLRDRGSLSVRQIADIVGCSTPTVLQGIDLLRSRGELVDGIDTRGVMLRSFPTRTFEQGAGLAGTLRKTRWFRDVSGAPDPNALLRRLRRQRPRAVAIGGVVAARWFDPHFDLHGIPRLDVICWAPYYTSYNAEFVKDLDPGLDSGRREEAVLAVHQLSRAESYFETSSDDGLPYADPVEVLLDLHDLRLEEQASALVQHLRRKNSRERERERSRP